jgi:hypothetical protein
MSGRPKGCKQIPWTEEEENIIVLNAFDPEMTWRENIQYVADLLPGRTFRAVSAKMSRMGISSRAAHLFLLEKQVETVKHIHVNEMVLEGLIAPMG